MVPDVASHSIADIVSLVGRSAVVTGGAMGLGKATAKRLAEAGASVVIGDIDFAAAEATARELATQSGRSVLAVHMDVSDGHSIASVADFALERLGRLDVWVNNAGIPSIAALTDVEEAEWDRVMAIHLRGTMLGAREAAHRMIQAGNGGVIVNLASLAGMCGIAGQATYGASKAGVIGLTRHLAVDLAPDGIRVLAIAPGANAYGEQDVHRGYGSSRSQAERDSRPCGKPSWPSWRPRRYCSCRTVLRV